MKVSTQPSHHPHAKNLDSKATNVQDLNRVWHHTLHKNQTVSWIVHFVHLNITITHVPRADCFNRSEKHVVRQVQENAVGPPPSALRPTIRPGARPNDRPKVRSQFEECTECLQKKSEKTRRAPSPRDGRGTTRLLQDKASVSGALQRWNKIPSTRSTNSVVTSLASRGVVHRHGRSRKVCVNLSIPNRRVSRSVNNLAMTSH